MSAPLQDQYLNLSGIEASTGNCLNPPIELPTLARLLVEQRGSMSAALDDATRRELEMKLRGRESVSFGIPEGGDLGDLGHAGWSIVFPSTAESGRQQAIKEALRPLCDHRRKMTGGRFRLFEGTDGIGPGETKQRFLARHGVRPGAADPEQFPHYLLLVGSPEEIPWMVQRRFDMQCAVGRLHFETVEEYARYAESVVRWETSPPPSVPRPAVFFAPLHDSVTEIAERQLLTPLKESLGRFDYPCHWLIGPGARKSELAAILQHAPPAFLFAACHGVVDPDGPRNGALLCQDWPGLYDWKVALPPSFSFGGDDIAPDANLNGLIAFLYSTCGLGTDGDAASGGNNPVRLPKASRSTISPLPQRLLSQGALAVAGTVGLRLGASVVGGTGTSEGTSQVFASVLVRLLRGGAPVGYAFDYVNERHAELALTLSESLDAYEFGRSFGDRELVELWTDTEDAGSIMLLGDPAVRLRPSAT